VENVKWRGLAPTQNVEMRHPVQNGTLSSAGHEEDAGLVGIARSREVADHLTAADGQPYSLFQERGSIAIGGVPSSKLTIFWDNIKNYKIPLPAVRVLFSL